MGVKEGKKEIVQLSMENICTIRKDLLADLSALPPRLLLLAPPPPITYTRT